MRKNILTLITSLLFLLQTNSFAQTNCGWKLGDVNTYSQIWWGGTGPDAGVIYEKFGPLYFSSAGLLEVGIPGSGGNSIRLSSASAVIDYLPASGTAAALTNDAADPTTTSSGVFGGEVVALKLNIDFTAAGITSNSSTNLGQLVLNNSLPALNGMTVSQLLGIANTLLGGGAGPVSINDLNTILQEINNSFDKGVASQFALDHLTGWSAGELLTYTQSGWGGGNGITFLANGFGPLYFSSGGHLEVGIAGSAGYSIRFGSGSAVLSYLPAQGLATALTADVVDPTSTSSGLLGGEVVALKLNVDFTDGGIIHGNSGVVFGDLVLKDLAATVYNGLTVRQFLALAETALGGGAVTGSIADIVVLCGDLNHSFWGGVPSQFAQEHLRKGWSSGEMITYTHGVWGNNASPAAALLNSDFGTVYFNAGGVLEVGISGSGGFSMSFTGGAAIETFLPSAGNPATLTADQVDPTTTSSGIFGGEVTALHLNVDYNDAGVLTGSSTVLFGDLILTGLTTLPYFNTITGSLSSFNGSTVRDVLAIAETALGGGSISVPIADIFALTQALNGAFANGTPSQFAQEHLKKGWSAGDFETYNQSGWDAGSGAVILATNGGFNSLYGATGVSIGENFTLRFTSSAAVFVFLPADGNSSSLNTNSEDAITTSAGEFAGQVLALEFNVDFSDAGFITTGTQQSIFGDLVINNFSQVPAVNGMSIREFLTLANHILGGGSAVIGPSTANIVANLLNNAFLNGVPSQFAKDHLISPCDVVNHCPTATSANVTTSVGTAANIQLQATDDDNDELTYSISVNALHGIVTTSASGAAIYTPTAGYYGTDEFKFKAGDGSCDGEGTVSITVVQCPKGAGYWKNNSVAWPVTSLMLGSQTYSQTQLLNILNMPIGSGPKADASLILADQLIGVKLSLANGSPVATDLSNAIASADALIGSNTIPMKIKPNSSLGQQMIAIANFLASYNLGSLTEGCHAPAVTSSKQTNGIIETTASIIDGMQVNAYPNPSNNNFSITVQADAQEKIMMQVIDMYGRIIETRNVIANSITRFGQGYATGTYFVRIIQGKEHKVLKLIKIN